MRNQRGIYTRPTVKEVYKYRKYVDEHIHKLLNKKDIPIKVKQLTTLGINHEQQHQELLLTDLKYTFSLNILYPVYDLKFNINQDQEHESGWINIEEGIYDIGYQGDDFCYDNELGKHQVFLSNYQIAKSLVTNGDFIDFIEQGGYNNFNYWLDDGWSWVTNKQITNPLYWQKIDGNWWYYTLAGLQPINKDAVLTHVSLYEANAFANFKNMRLPTEFEWEVASNKFKWGLRWEHTSSAYNPYPNFKMNAGAIGEYNGKFMLNQTVQRGGSVLTIPGHSRYSYRNFFYPNKQWQYSGIRLVKKD